MRGMELYVRVNCVSVKVFVWKVGVKMSVSVCDLTVCTEVSIQHSQAPCCSSRYSKPGFCHSNGGGWQNPQQGICLWRLRRSGGVGLTRDTWGWNHVANHIFWRCCLQTLVCQGAVIMKLANPISIGRIQFCKKKKTKQNKKYCQSVKDTKRPFRRIALYCGGRVNDTQNCVLQFFHFLHGISIISFQGWFSGKIEEKLDLRNLWISRSVSCIFSVLCDE